jgi:NhaP-type Na+/H+ or K+/H+ antiporter
LLSLDLGANFTLYSRFAGDYTFTIPKRRSQMKITTNQNTFERFARILVGGVLLLLATYIPMNTIAVWSLFLIGIVLMLTGLSGWCPIYALLKYSSK